MYARSSAQSPLPPAAHVQTEKQCQHRNNGNPSRGNYAPQACSGSSGGDNYLSSGGGPQAAKGDIPNSCPPGPVFPVFFPTLQNDVFPPPPGNRLLFGGGIPWPL